MRLHRHNLRRLMLLAAAVAVGTANASVATAQNKDWEFEAGLLFLQHGESNSVPIVQTLTGGHFVDADDHGFEFDTGYEFGLSIPIEEGIRIRGRYNNMKWLSNYTASRAVPSVITPNSRIMTNPPSPVPGAPIRSVSSSYESKLQGAELMLSTAVVDTQDYSMAFNAGFRWIGLDERYANAMNSVGPFSVGVIGLTQDTDNQMYGFQIGTEGTYAFDDVWGLDWFGNIGVFGNSASQDTSLTVSRVPIVNSGVSHSRDLTSLVGELGLGVTYRTSAAWWLRAGYRVMWLDGVALAPDQLGQTSAFGTVPPTTDLDSGTLLVHGADLAVIFAY